MAGEGLRIDKWLWFARLAKTRTLAQKLAVSGRVRVNRRKNDSAAHQVKVGDVLTIAFDASVRVFRVTGLGARRGPAAEARLLYEDLSPPPPTATPRRSGRPAAAARPSGTAALSNDSAARNGVSTTIFRPESPDRQNHPPPGPRETSGFLRIFCKPVRQHAFAVPSARAGQAEVNAVTYVVNENCIKCKYMDCIEVCPVDCFYEGENMLVIHPDECIDCGVCEPECPIDAIRPDTEPGLEKWLKVNAEYASKWPNITAKKEPPADGKDFEGVDAKFEKFFSPEPGEGD